MADFGLVRGVGREELATGHELEDRGGDVVAVEPGANEGGHAAQGHVRPEQPPRIGDDLLFRLRRAKRQVLRHPNAFGNVGKQVVDAGEPHRFEHLCLKASVWELVNHAAPLCCEACSGRS